MVQFTILAGGYTGFIATYLLNITTLPASLTLLGRFPSENPSWIATNARRDILYAVNEVPKGAVQAFSINSNGSLSGPTDAVSTEGNGPAFCVQLSSGEVAAMNFGSGNGSFTHTTNGGSNFGQSSFITFPPPPYAPPKNVSNPHMALEVNSSNGSEILVADLGGDAIWRLKGREDGSGYEILSSIRQPEGSGPRHIAVYGGDIYTVYEKNNSVSVQGISASADGTAIIRATASTIPPNPPSGAIFAAAEILIPPPCSRFPEPLIYVSNRNIANPNITSRDIGNSTAQGDSIAIFEHVKQGEQESLVLVKQVFTGLSQIRGMQFGNADNGGEEYLIAGAASGTGGVAVFRRTEGGRNLELIARNTDVPTATSFSWL